MVQRPEADGPGVEQADAAARRVPVTTTPNRLRLELAVAHTRCSPWWRRVAETALAVAVVTLTLVPPFTPPMPWRWVTDRVPWQLVEQAPWALPTRSLRVRGFVCAPVITGDPRGAVVLSAFGYSWVSDPMPGLEGGQTGPASFHLLDHTHGVFVATGGTERITLTRRTGKVFCFD